MRTMAYNHQSTSTGHLSMAKHISLD
uniref:Uncharacterized protein n=1 Tax=Arundo donax TaxID=35708 RepID=A0A0A9HNA6_ARUDO